MIRLIQSLIAAGLVFISGCHGVPAYGKVAVEQAVKQATLNK
jgi:hypothetical protein